jgi:hypothetical protein
MDYQTLAIIAGVVAIVAIVLYVWDSRTKNQSIDVTSAAKVGLGAGAIAGGVAYAVGTDEASAMVENVASTVQDMFVGKPGF